MTWKTVLNDNPIPWLLEPDPENPSVRYFTLRELLDRPEDAPEVQEARAAIKEALELYFEDAPGQEVIQVAGVEVETLSLGIV